MKTLIDIKKEVAEEMGFDLDTPTWRIHFSKYTNTIAQRYSDERLKEYREKVLGTLDALKISGRIRHDQHSEIIAFIKDIQP